MMTSWCVLAVAAASGLHTRGALLTRSPVRRIAVRASASVEDALDAWMSQTHRDETPVAVSVANDFALALQDFWAQVCITPDSPFPERALAFPGLDVDAASFGRFMHHINTCSEVCEILGQSLFVALRHPEGQVEGEPPVPCPMLLLKSYGSAGGEEPVFNDEDDAFFDDWPDFDDVDLGAEGGGGAASDASDEEVLAGTRKWVEAVICHMQVCPFSSTADRAGLPPGGVTYPICRATSADEVYLEFWHQVQKLNEVDERTMSTVLLVTPAFCAQSPGGFDQFADTLNEALSLLGVEALLQLVFFHPEYTFRDGKARAGDEGAANFARRSPWPMINLLRTPQVRAAQKGIPTGSVYTVNEQNMAAVGKDQLERMLRNQDWSGIFQKNDWVQHAGRE